MWLSMVAFNFFLFLSAKSYLSAFKWKEEKNPQTSKEQCWGGFVHFLLFTSKKYKESEV